jgi:aminopeptidase YwaD
MDKRRDRLNVGKYPLIYEDGGLRLFRVNVRELAGTESQYDFTPLRATNMKIEFREQKEFDWRALSTGVDLDSLIGLVEEDSLISYAERMQAFYRRVLGTDSNAACADWLISKFEEFGYDSVVSDTFTENYGDEPILLENVIAYKLGTLYPDRHIVIGGHRDAVPGTPGVDDNASGTVAALEIARVLKDIETKVTFVFIAFDGEETGYLYGSYHYANEAAERGDTILFMLNSDMIGHHENSDTSWIDYGIDTTFTTLWKYLADSLAGIVGMDGQSGTSGSDHVAFTLNGYPTGYIHEYIFSTHYHQPSDSTTYINFDYVTRLTQASLATTYVTMLEATMSTIEFTYPSGVPRFVTPGDAIIRGIGIAAINGGEMIPGSATIHYSHNGAPYESASMTEISEDLYEYIIPEVACGDFIDCYFTAEEAVTGLVFEPDSLKRLRLEVATSYAIVLDENFEMDNGWIVYGDAEHGHWERAVPIQLTSAGAPSEDFDGSSRCYLTANNFWSPDLDGGSTVLTSPSFDLSSGDARIRYARWFDTYSYGQPDQDSMVVFMSSDAGMNWTEVETVGPEGEQASGGWYTHEFWASAYVSPTSSMKLRFIASDIGDNNRVEAAIDALLIASFECDYEPPLCVHFHERPATRATRDRRCQLFELH